MKIIKNIEKIFSNKSIGIFNEITKLKEYNKNNLLNFLIELKKYKIETIKLDNNLDIYQIKLPENNKDIILKLKKRYFLLQIEDDIFSINSKNRIFAYENINLDKSINYISFKIDKKSFFPKDISSINFLFPEKKYCKITLQRSKEEINIIKGKHINQEIINSLLNCIDKKYLLENGSIKKEEYEILNLQNDNLIIIEKLYNTKNKNLKVKNEIRN